MLARIINYFSVMKDLRLHNELLCLQRKNLSRRIRDQRIQIKRLAQENKYMKDVVARQQERNDILVEKVRDERWAKDALQIKLADIEADKAARAAKRAARRQKPALFAVQPAKEA